MFDLVNKVNGEQVLVYTRRYRYPGERGVWVEICHENDKEAKKYVDMNRRGGTQVEKDENGFYRALILKD